MSVSAQHLLIFMFLFQAILTRELYIGDLEVKNNFIFSHLDVTEKLQCRNLIVSNLSSETLTSSSLTMNRIYVKEIINKNSNNSFITLEGSLNIRGSINWDASPTEKTPENGVTTSQTSETNVAQNPIPTSFLQVDELILNGVKQWVMIDHESFDYTQFSQLKTSEKEINGWRVKNNQEKDFETIIAPALNNVYISNDDDKALFANHANVIFKEFKNLPRHSDLMVQAQLLVHGPMWKGEALFAKVNKKIVWMQHYDSEDAFENCEKNDETWHRIPIAFVIEHLEDSFLFEIGTNNPTEKIEGCENVELDHTLGLDDFIMYIQ